MKIAAILHSLGNILLNNFAANVTFWNVYKNIKISTFDKL